MSDWIRDPKTDLIKINSDRINEIVRKLMDKIKILTLERDHAVNEYNILKQKYTKLLESLGRGHYTDEQVKEMECDDLETDGPSSSLPDMRGLSEKEDRGENSKKKDSSLLHSTDHSACCSKELSMKLVEQNEILQKTIRDILKLRGHSIDDYLKFTYSREKLMAKDREISDLKLKIKKLKEKEDTKLPASDSDIDLCKKVHLPDSETITDLSKQLADACLQKESKETNVESTKRDISILKDLGRLACATCKKKFPSEAQTKDHERKCSIMLN